MERADRTGIDRGAGRLGSCNRAITAKKSRHHSEPSRLDSQGARSLGVDPFPSLE